MGFMSRLYRAGPGPRALPATDLAALGLRWGQRDQELGEESTGRWGVIGDKGRWNRRAKCWAIARKNQYSTNTVVVTDNVTQPQLEHQRANVISFIVLIFCLVVAGLADIRPLPSLKLLKPALLTKARRAA